MKTNTSKRTKLTSIVLTLVILLTCTTFAFSAQAEEAALPTENWSAHKAEGYAGGTGTQDDPYTIATAEQLAYFGSIIDAGTATNQKYFKVTADLDMGAYLWKTKNDSVFKGYFDGNGHTIDNVKIKDTEDSARIAFFNTAEDAKFENLTLKVSLYDAAIRTAGLVGWVKGTTTISNVNVYIDVDVKGKSLSDPFIGGVVGYVGGSCLCENVNVYGSISIESNGTITIGGVVGRLTQRNTDGGIFKNCNNYADLTLKNTSGTLCFVGGILGRSWVDNNADKTLRFTQCANYGTLTIEDAQNHTSAIGGILGACHGGGNNETLVFEACLNAGALVDTNDKGTQHGAMFGYAASSNNTVTCTGCLSSTENAMVGANVKTPTLNGCATGISLKTETGARVRLDTDGETSGIRFDSAISQDTIATLKAATGITIELGTLIAPTANLVAVADAYDLIAALTAAGVDTFVKVAYTSTTYLDAEDEDHYGFSGAIGKMNAENYEIEFSAVAYLTVTTENGSITLYANNGIVNGAMSPERTRSIKQVATLALADTDAGYTDPQKALLQVFAAGKPTDTTAEN